MKGVSFDPGFFCLHSQKLKSSFSGLYSPKSSTSKYNQFYFLAFEIQYTQESSLGEVNLSF